MSLTNMVQIICLEERRTALVLKGKNEVGTIFFDSGDIIHATLGPLVGDDAVFELLTWTEGDFRLKNDLSLPRRTVTTPWNHLMMEGMRRLDEHSAAEQTKFEMARLLSTTEISRDLALEHDLIGFLSKLEQLGAQLDKKKTIKKPTSALAILTEMINQIEVFAEELLGNDLDETLKDTLKKVQDESPVAGLLQNENKPMSDQIVALYNRWSDEFEDRKKTFKQVSMSMIEVLRVYFSLFTAYFRSSSVADQWMETGKVFLSDLEKVVEKVEF